MPSAPVSLRKIAEKAGVSHVTVSLALRNHRSIPEATRKRIQNLAEEMGYRRDPEVSKLMARIREKRPVDYQGTLAWLTAWPTRDGWRRWLTYEREFLGAQSRADELGYKLEAFWYTDPDCSPKRLASILMGRGVEGIVVAALPDGLHSLEFRWEEFSCAGVGMSLHAPRLHCTETAHTHNVELVLRTLSERGFQRPGMVLTRDMDERVGHSWSGTYLSEQLRRPRRQRIPLLYEKEIPQKTFEAWLIQHKPDVVIANQFDIVDWIQGAGLRVPEDVAHARLDTYPRDLPWDRLKWKPEPVVLSGINQLPEIVGVSAVDSVVSQIIRNERGVPAHPTYIQVRGEWMDGETV